MHMENNIYYQMKLVDSLEKCASGIYGNIDIRKHSYAIIYVNSRYDNITSTVPILQNGTLWLTITLPATSRQQFLSNEIKQPFCGSNLCIWRSLKHKY